MWSNSHSICIPFVSGLVYNNPMAIKIEGDKVIVTTNTSAHRVIKKDPSIKASQMGECSICGEVLLYYMSTKNKGWFTCSTASKKNSVKFKKKRREDAIRKDDKYLSVG